MLAMTVTAMIVSCGVYPDKSNLTAIVKSHVNQTIPADTLNSQYAILIGSGVIDGVDVHGGSCLSQR